MTELNDGLNAQQRAAAEFSGRNLLVLAGAGTGKTRTIIARARHLLRTGVDPNRILILSFTKKSAREIVNRLACAQTDGDAPHGQTFHSWCMELITSNPEVFRFGRFVVIDDDDTEQAFKLVCGKNFNKDNYIQPKTLAAVYSYMVNTCTNLTEALKHLLFNDNVDARRQEQIMQKRPIYEGAIRQYMAFKNERGYLDYDDLLMRVANGLAKNPQAADYIAARYDHILVDEMQDTNPLQYRLLSSFWSRCNLFCVGDDAQSIYGFRGADFQSIHSFECIVPQAKKQLLTLNYRSTQEILDLANWVLASSPLNYDKYLEAARGAGHKPVVLHYVSEYDQARDIVERIRDGLASEGLAYHDHMVLSRSNWGLRPIEQCLLEAKIPYVIYGGTALTKSAHVRDVMSALRIVANPVDELAWMRFLQLFPGIGDKRAGNLIGKLITHDSLAAALDSVEGDPLMPRLAIETLRAVMEVQAQVAKAVRRASLKLAALLEANYKESWPRRRQDFTVLENIANYSESIAAFIADYNLDPSLGTATKDGSDPQDCVVISTIHSAKGLEATNCYLVNANFRQYPSAKAVEMGQDAIEEDRRCLYVALTRAKDRLFIYRDVTCINVTEDNNSDDTNKYYFLNNIPSHLIEMEYLGETARRYRPYAGPGLTLTDADDLDFS